MSKKIPIDSRNFNHLLESGMSWNPFHNTIGELNHWARKVGFQRYNENFYLNEIFDRAKEHDPYYFCRGVCCDSCETKPCLK